MLLLRALMFLITVLCTLSSIARRIRMPAVAGRCRRLAGRVIHSADSAETPTQRTDASFLRARRPIDGCASCGSGDPCVRACSLRCEISVNAKFDFKNKHKFIHFRSDLHFNNNALALVRNVFGMRIREARVMLHVTLPELALSLAFYGCANVVNFGRNVFRSAFLFVQRRVFPFNFCRLLFCLLIQSFINVFAPLFSRFHLAFLSRCLAFPRSGPGLIAHSHGIHTKRIAKQGRARSKAELRDREARAVRAHRPNSGRASGAPLLQ